MAINMMNAVWKSDAPRHLKLVLLCLANYANEKGGNAYPSIKRIARYCALQERTVSLYLRKLREQKYIEVEEPADPVEKKPTVYRILLKPSHMPKKSKPDHNEEHEWEYDMEEEAFPYPEQL